MKTVIYFLRNDAPLYMDTYFLDKALKAFEAVGIRAHELPNTLQEQAI